MAIAAKRNPMIHNLFLNAVLATYLNSTPNLFLETIQMLI